MQTNNKLREALEKVRDSFYVNDYGDYQMECGDKVSDLVDAALAAPPRNCDKYTSLDEARNAYMAINEMPEENRDEDMRRWLCDFHNWLFAPATEKEGGNNAD